MFLKVGKLDKIGNRDRKTVPDPESLVKNCKFFDIRATGMHAIITSCSCVVCMDLTVCHKQIEEKWRQQIIVVAEYECSNIEGIDLEDV